MGESESADEHSSSKKRRSKRFRWRSRKDRERSVESSGESSAEERETGSRSCGSRREREPQQKLETIGDSGNEAGSSNDEGEDAHADKRQEDRADDASISGAMSLLADVAEAVVGPSSEHDVSSPVKKALASPGLMLQVDLPPTDDAPDSRSETTTPAATPDRVGDFSPNERPYSQNHSQPEASPSGKDGHGSEVLDSERQMVKVKVEKGGKNGFRLAALLWGNGDVAVARLKKLEQEAAAKGTEAAAKGQEGGLLSPKKEVRGSGKRSMHMQPRSMCTWGDLFRKRGKRQGAGHSVRCLPVVCSDGGRSGPLRQVPERTVHFLSLTQPPISERTLWKASGCSC